jgi:hypothetical protein
MVVPGEEPIMTATVQTEKADLRELPLEEMERVSGGEFMNPDEWITARIIVMEDTAKGILKP